MAELDRETRECLLQTAKSIVDSCRQDKDGDKVLKMTSLVLFELKRRRDLDWMKTVLDAKHASDMSAPYWKVFQEKVKGYAKQLENSFPAIEKRTVAWMYLLGWLHRLANYAKSPSRQQRSRHRRYR